MLTTSQQMQETNRNLLRLLDLIRKQELGPLRPDAVDLASLLAELKKAEQLRMEGTKNGAALNVELVEYRKTLEELGAIVPSLQARYGAERARLQRDRTHLNAASGWAHSQEMLYRR